MPIRTWGLTSFTLAVGVGGGGPASPWTIPVGIAVGVALVGAALAGLHYTRIGREQVLQRKIRLLMYEYVRDNPGASFTAVRDAMGLKNGVAAYHLGVLETQELLHSESRRRHRWYYANGAASVWKALPLSPLQSSIIEAVRRSPGIGIRELARALGRRSSPVAYNVKMLAREGVLRTELTGRMLHCYPAE
jgi:predicted transcriptional regulator